MRRADGMKSAPQEIRNQVRSRLYPTGNFETAKNKKTFQRGALSLWMQPWCVFVCLCVYLGDSFSSPAEGDIGVSVSVIGCWP